MIGNAFLKRDIEQRFKIHKAAFEQMAQHLLNVSPVIVVDKELQKLFEFKSEHTSKNYVGYLKQAYLAILVIQVSYGILSSKTRKREISGLLPAARKTGCKKLLLLTDHEYEDIEEDGYLIGIRPVYDYVLQDFI